ncbi:hypothetical protein ACFU44_13840 [Nocardia rhizosphaerihabitans]|uniref:hypothetical protein n=1 Tax=Nocardia rhizosphaerihabitans TaxID=1691570 RepID=UPI0036721408
MAEKLIKVVPGLNEETYQLVERLWWSYKYETCPNYGHLEAETDLSRDVLNKHLDTFKKLGFVKTVRGLMTEDGEVAGSGFSLTSQDAFHLIELAMYRYNYNDQPYGRTDDYVPRVLKVGEYEYRLKLNGDSPS